MRDNTYKEGNEYFAKTGTYTHWIVYSPEKDEVVALFLDTTQAVKANRAMDRSENYFRISLPIFRREWKFTTRTVIWSI